MRTRARVTSRVVLDHVRGVAASPKGKGPDRGYGRVRPSEKEIHGAQIGQIQVVIVNRPTVPKYVEPPPLDAPKFREDEIVPKSFR